MAMDQIAEKGGKESLLVTQDAAFVVSVENRTIITVMDQSELRDNVFTKIDSAMLLLD
jgi:flagellar operon protein